MIKNSTPAPLPAPTRQAIEAKGRSAPLKVTGKLKAALDRMIWLGERRAAAAENAGLKDHSLRSALKKTHVLRYYRAELAALREAERPRNIHALVDVRDGKNEMARVHAVRILEQLADSPHAAGSNAQRQPGMIVVVVQPGEGAPPQPGPLKPKPYTIEHDAPEDTQ